MKRILTVLAVAMVMQAAVVAAAQGAAGGRGPKVKGEQAAERMQKRRAMMAKRLGEAIEALGLDEAKAAQVRQIFQTHRQAMENWRQENGQQMRPLHQKLRAAVEAGNQDQIKTLRQQLRKLHESRKPLMENLKKQLGEVLDEKQMAKLTGLFRPGMRPGAILRRALGQLDLTDEQKAIVKNAREQAKDKDPKERCKIMTAAFEKLKGTLSKEQKEKLEQMRQRRRRHMRHRVMRHALAKVDLTEEQKAALKKARDQAKDMPREQRREHMKAAFEKILTDEQKEKLKGMRKARGERMRKRIFVGMNLTDTQTEQIKAIMTGARDRAGKAETPAQRRQIMAAARKEVREKVLTEAQRKKVQENLKNLRKRRRMRGGVGGGRVGPAVE